MEKLKSLTIITLDYPAANHPQYVFVQQLAHALMDEGVKVSVVVYQSIIHALVHKEKLLPRHSIAKTESGINYEVYRPYTLSFGSHKYLKKIADWVNGVILVSKIRRLNNSVIYAHFWESSLPIFKYAFNKKIPLFIACGEGDNAIENMVKTMPKDSLKTLSKAVSGVISVSSENKRKCIAYSLCQEDSIAVFPNCVNTNLFYKKESEDIKQKLGIEESDFVISFVGVFEPRKGPDRLAEAVKRLNDSHIKVMFIGKQLDGYDYDFTCPGIVYKGSLDHNLLPQYLNCSDIFVLPTQKEGCCNAIVESLAMGIPVVSSIGSFNDDILDDNNSIRVDPNDIDAITEAIKTLRVNKLLRKSMSSYSLSRHEEYSIQGRAKRILSFIEKNI